jgi:hypothetical protein
MVLATRIIMLESQPDGAIGSAFVTLVIERVDWVQGQES